MTGNCRTAIVTSLALLASGCGKSPKEEATTKAAAPEALEANAKLPSGMLDRRNLIEFAMAVRDYKPRDEFSSQAFNDAPLASRAFRIDLDMSDPQNAELDKIYNYDVDKKVLKLSLYPGPIQIFKKTTELPSESRSNAFGATVKVTRKEIEGFFVGYRTFDPFDYIKSDKRPRELGVFKIGTKYETSLAGTQYASVDTKYFVSELIKFIPMSPQKAREVTRSLRLVVDGAITKNDSANQVECYKDAESTATISSPFETILNSCIISARFTRIQVLSSKAGLLASWE